MKRSLAAQTSCDAGSRYAKRGVPVLDEKPAIIVGCSHPDHSRIHGGWGCGVCRGCALEGDMIGMMPP